MVDHVKALLISICNNTVWSGGFGWLKPFVKSWFRSFKADTMESFLLKPCWKSGKCKCVLSSGRTRLSKILAAGQSIEMGR